MGVKKDSLIKAFEEARLMNYPYVFVKIEAEGIVEYIAVPEQSFVAKEKFYSKAYNDDLVHVMNSNVKIQEVGYGTEHDLLKFV